MKTGTARQGMRVRIIGNCNSHGFKIGQVITLGGRLWYPLNEYGYSFAAKGAHGYEYSIREIDMAPVGATLV